MQPKTATKRDQLAARLMRGSQPGRARVAGKRFSKDNQPRGRRGRPKGSPNVYSRDIKEAIIAAANIVGEDGQGKDGLVGYMEDLARNEKAIFGGMLRGVMGTQVTVEQVERPKEYLTTEDILAELKSCGIIPPELKTLEIVLDTDDVSDEDPKTTTR